MELDDVDFETQVLPLMVDPVGFKGKVFKLLEEHPYKYLDIRVADNFNDLPVPEQYLAELIEGGINTLLNTEPGEIHKGKLLKISYGFIETCYTGQESKYFRIYTKRETKKAKLWNPIKTMTQLLEKIF